MSEIPQAESSDNRLLSVSLRRPILVMLVLFLVACLIKILDVFVFRLDELVGEAILTKALGFVLVVLYVKACGRSLRDIGFRGHALGRALLIGAVPFIGLYVLAFTAQIALLRASGEDAGLALSAVDPKTGMSGGLLFGLWLLLANLVNSAMEEGLFRGTMVRHFRIRYAAWGAILLQAGFFAIWHLNWPVRQLLDGEATISQAAFEASALLVSTGIAGVVYGYLYVRTGSLWAPFLAHTINNSVLNVLFIRTASGVQPSTDLAPFLGVFLIGHLLLIPIIGFLAKRLGMPEAEPWGFPT